MYHHNDDGSRFKLKYDRKYVKGRKVFISFDTNKNTKGTFHIHIYNPVASGVAMSVDLVNGGYKMLPLNETYTTMLKPNEKKIFEGFGVKSKYFYFDQKICFGKTDVKFYQGDYGNVLSKKALDKTQIIDNTSNVLVHYFKVEKEKVFMEVTNKSEKDNAIFSLLAYQEKDMKTNPYSEVSLLNDGKVNFETDQNRISFQALQIKSKYESSYFHNITYRLYLSQDFDAMRYVKNCGEYLFEDQFPDSDLVVSDLTMKLSASIVDEP